MHFSNKPAQKRPFPRMKPIDTTAASSHAKTRTLFSSLSAERASQLTGQFRSHLLGIYLSKVGSEWGSGGRREGDYLHHIDIAIKGHRQLISAGLSVSSA